MSDQLWHLLQTTDSTFPVGGFAHSYGLEGLVQNHWITNSEELRSYIRNVWIPMFRHVDFPIVRLSREYAYDENALFRIDQLAWATRATAESRRAQSQMGQQRLKMTAGLTGHHRLSELLNAMLNHRWMANWPTVCGVESACLNQKINDTLLAYGYQNINGILAASAKLIRIGPTEIQSILHALRDPVAEAVDGSATISEDEIGWFTPMLDISGARHEHAYSRLFIS